MHKVPRRLLIGFGMLLLIVGITGLIAWELLSSAVEAKYLAKTAQKMTWQMQDGPSKRIRYPGEGPYDIRLGYSKLPDYLQRLDKAGWNIDQQAKITIQMARVSDLGLFMPYHEKDHAGLSLLDNDNKLLYQGMHPSRVYDRFEEIPDVLVNALLYIENRELLTEQYPTRNPAVEWDRLAQALLEKGISLDRHQPQRARWQHAADADRKIPAFARRPDQQHGQRNCARWPPPACVPIWMAPTPCRCGAKP